MTPSSLSRHLILIVAIKLLVLFALWWVFVRDARLEVESEGAASRILSTPEGHAR